MEFARDIVRPHSVLPMDAAMWDVVTVSWSSAYDWEMWKGFEMESLTEK